MVTTPRRPLTILAALSLAGAARGQCNTPGVDLVVQSIDGLANYITDTTTYGVLDCVSVGYTLANHGTAMASWEADSAHHPVVAMGLFRLRLERPESLAWRIEQIGVSWATQEFFPLQQPSDCTPCNAGDGRHLGPGCATTTSASGQGTQQRLGPRWQIDPWTGVFTYPVASPPFSGPSARRLAATLEDLTPQTDDLFYIEAQVVNSDEAVAGRGNNASVRPVHIAGSETSRTLSLLGTTTIGRAAIQSWADADPEVTILTVDVPGTGRIIVAGRASPPPLPGGPWHYEYAVQNVNSAAAVRTLELAVGCGSDEPGFIVGAWFHGVIYRNGDGIPTDPQHPNTNARDFDATPWPEAISPGGISWSTPDDANANALRWGTLYNFSFDCAAAPRPDGEATLGFLTATGGRAPIAVAGLPVPLPRFGPADFDGDGFLDFLDVDAFVRCFEGADCPPGRTADFNADGFVDLFDFDDYVHAFERGC